MGLAPLLIREIFNIIVDINKAGTTVLLVEQNVKQSMEIADRAYVLENGRIAEQGTHRELMDKNELYRHLWDMSLRLSEGL